MILLVRGATIATNEVIVPCVVKLLMSVLFHVI